MTTQCVTSAHCAAAYGTRTDVANKRMKTGRSHPQVQIATLGSRELLAFVFGDDTANGPNENLSATLILTWCLRAMAAFGGAIFMGGSSPDNTSQYFATAFWCTVRT
jgi:hypothetical protein